LKRIVRAIAMAVLPAVLMALISGCFTKSADDLYALPELSEGYLQLQEQLSAILSKGAEYAPPMSGMNRQSVQLEDLDGDGEKEALAFFVATGDPKPLKIVIFKRLEGEYTEVARIEGEGANIESIYYADFDGSGRKEIIVGWQIGAGMGILALYSLRDYQINMLVSTDYTEYNVYDLNRDSTPELLVTRLSQSELSGEVTMYSVEPDGEVTTSSAHLSSGVEALQRIRIGMLRGHVPALFVESGINGSAVVTDILVADGAGIRNLTANPVSGISEETVRTYKNVYCTDVDGDGVMDVPRPVLLPMQTETSYWSIDWYNYETGGKAEKIMSTYHNYTDGWYVILPDDWVGNITIRREDTVSGERAIVFSALREEGMVTEDFLIIYTLSGVNKEERARAEGRFVLAQENSVFAARLLVDADDYFLTVDRTALRQCFRIIHSEWVTGETQ
jgi:hypothetical protein